MTEKKEIARNTMVSGFNCAQSVFSTFAPELGVSKTDALRVAGPFGAGMGLMGHVCGAVTGAFMTIGLKFAKTADGEDEKKARGYALVQEFSDAFEKKHGSIHCRELIGVDLRTSAGMAQAQEDGVFQNKCVRYVEDAAELVEQLLKRDE
jgi:C_GCAxxG_C_C family probable redox protein